jgi:hypothetical protein
MLPNAPLAQPEMKARYGLQTVRMKNYCFLFDSQKRDEVPEEVEIVFATGTMPRQDLERSLGFSAIIYNLHAYGWTQVISRVLHMRGVTFTRFYQALEAWILAGNGAILSREYEATLAAFRTMVDTGDYIVDRFLRGTNVGSVPIGLRSQATCPRYILGKSKDSERPSSRRSNALRFRLRRAQSGEHRWALMCLETGKRAGGLIPREVLQGRC